jgi:hypothetical protein
MEQHRRHMQPLLWGLGALAGLYAIHAMVRQPAFCLCVFLKIVAQSSVAAQRPQLQAPPNGEA